jgi:hypothetical protein
MFGIAAFAQSPFASLGGTAFALSISEAITLADSSAQASTFLQSRAENIGIADVINDAGANYFGSVTEAITLADSSSQASTFLQSIAENLNPADSQTITGQFAVMPLNSFLLTIKLWKVISKGRKYSEEAKEKIRQASIAQWARYHANGNKHIPSDE